MSNSKVSSIATTNNLQQSNRRFFAYLNSYIPDSTLQRAHRLYCHQVLLFKSNFLKKHLANQDQFKNFPLDSFKYKILMKDDQVRRIIHTVIKKLGLQASTIFDLPCQVNIPAAQHSNSNLQRMSVSQFKNHLKSRNEKISLLKEISRPRQNKIIYLQRQSHQPSIDQMLFQQIAKSKQIIKKKPMLGKSGKSHQQRGITQSSSFKARHYSKDFTPLMNSINQFLSKKDSLRSLNRMKVKVPGLLNFESNKQQESKVDEYMHKLQFREKLFQEMIKGLQDKDQALSKIINKERVRA